MLGGKNKGITLVALVITIVILLIFAGISISTLTNTEIFQKAKNAKQKTKDTELEQRTKLNEYENEIDKYIPPNQATIDKKEPKVGYYADINGDGTIDGIIYADLAVGNTTDGKWTDNDGLYTIPKIEDDSKLKEYYVSKEEYTEGKFGKKPVLTPLTGSTGDNRFYIMSLNDIVKDEKSTFDWYNAAYSYGMNDYATTTSGEFGKGKINTISMIEKWNSKKYGEQNTCSNHKDVWGQIQAEVTEGWFVPSRGEWSAFAKELGITKTDYNSKYGLSDWYWSSSQSLTDRAYYTNFNRGYLKHSNVNNYNYIRLSTTF